MEKNPEDIFWACVAICAWSLQLCEQINFLGTWTSLSCMGLFGICNQKDPNWYNWHNSSSKVRNFMHVAQETGTRNLRGQVRVIILEMCLGWRLMCLPLSFYKLVYFILHILFLHTSWARQTAGMQRIVWPFSQVSNSNPIELLNHNCSLSDVLGIVI